MGRGIIKLVQPLLPEEVARLAEKNERALSTVRMSKKNRPEMEIVTTCGCAKHGYNTVRENNAQALRRYHTERGATLVAEAESKASDLLVSASPL